MSEKCSTRKSKKSTSTKSTSMAHLILKGEFTGVKKFRPLLNPDIEYSTVAGVRCDINELSIKLNKAPDDATNTPPKLYLYHSFRSRVKNYTGRWYNLDFVNQAKYKVNQKTKTLHVKIPNWETDSGKLIKITVVIHFTERGWTKLSKTTLV